MLGISKEKEILQVAHRIFNFEPQNKYQMDFMRQKCFFINLKEKGGLLAYKT